MQQPKRIVYSAIVADIFHYGHLQSLLFANKQGDYHVIGILTDKAARYSKKTLVSNFRERRAIIDSLHFVDKVMVQNHHDPTDNLKAIHKKYPKAHLILVHGDDWRKVPGEQYLKKIKGKLVTHPYYTGLSDFKIIKNLLERYKGKFKNLEDFSQYFQLDDFTYFNTRRIEGEVFSSKADTLRYLMPIVKESTIEKTFVFTVLDWKEEQKDIIKQIQSQFKPKKIVVRSSAIDEDSKESSMAGAFHSELNVNTTSSKSITEAINQVIASYGEKNSRAMINQVLVQPHSQHITMSGVVFTRSIENNAPYYVINYDDTTGSTDSVTKGIESKTVRISKFSDKCPTKFKGLLKAVREIENLFPALSLDIEFGVNKAGRIIVFQVRPLAVHAQSENKDEAAIKTVLAQAKALFTKRSAPKKHLQGTRTCFGDMPDWNPAEIIGDTPNHLDFSLYDYIITRSAWHEARTSQGYTNVNPAQLVVLFGNKPYIDVRNSFNSYLPNTLPKNLKKKLITFYLNKLEKQPALQDKVEFDVLYTCFDVDFANRSKELLKAGFSKSEINTLRGVLIDITNTLIIGSKKANKQDMNAVFSLENSRKVKAARNYKEHLHAAKHLLDECRKKGTVQFSRLARLAFIGNIILKSLVKQKVISKAWYNSFLNAIQTVAKTMNNDFTKFLNGAMGEKTFLAKYGHLRPGTYDITSMRYDKSPRLLWATNAPLASHDDIEQFSPTQKDLEKIGRELKKYGLQMSAHDFLSFAQESIELRELAKFEFTKNLSAAIEHIAKAGKELGFSREQLAFLSINELFDVRAKNPAAVKKMWSVAIKQRKRERTINSYLALPPLLFSEEDFDVVAYYASKPNFITDECIEGSIEVIQHISDGTSIPDLAGKIILIENGDPGYDWIFTKNPAGLITKYGGAASHMAIRAAEFGLPAAIGSGELFDKVKNARQVILDCKSKKLIPL